MVIYVHYFVSLFCIPETIPVRKIKMCPIWPSKQLGGLVVIRCSSVAWEVPGLIPWWGIHNFSDTFTSKILVGCITDKYAILCTSVKSWASKMIIVHFVDSLYDLNAIASQLHLITLSCTMKIIPSVQKRIIKTKSRTKQVAYQRKYICQIRW